MIHLLVRSVAVRVLVAIADSVPCSLANPFSYWILHQKMKRENAFDIADFSWKPLDPVTHRKKRLDRSNCGTNWDRDSRCVNCDDYVRPRGTPL